MTTETLTDVAGEVPLTENVSRGSETFSEQDVTKPVTTDIKITDESGLTAVSADVSAAVSNQTITTLNHESKTNSGTKIITTMASRLQSNTLVKGKMNDIQQDNIKLPVTRDIFNATVLILIGHGYELMRPSELFCLLFTVVVTVVAQMWSLFALADPKHNTNDAVDPDSEDNFYRKPGSIGERMIALVGFIAYCCRFFREVTSMFGIIKFSKLLKLKVWHLSLFYLVYIYQMFTFVYGLYCTLIILQDQDKTYELFGQVLSVYFILEIDDFFCDAIMSPTVPVLTEELFTDTFILTNVDIPDKRVLSVFGEHASNFVYVIGGFIIIWTCSFFTILDWLKVGYPVSRCALECFPFIVGLYLAIPLMQAVYYKRNEEWYNGVLYWGAVCIALFILFGFLPLFFGLGLCKSDTAKEEEGWLYNN